MQTSTPNHRRLVAFLCLVGLGMFGFGYALVPLYNVLCKSLALNGKTSNEVATTESWVDTKRIITIEFLASRNASLPWRFYPEIKKISLHPGEMKKISYFASNDTDAIMTIQAIPSVTPGIAAQYLKKTECFCFRRQTFNAHQEMDLPVLFHIDPDLPPEINTITLSYTLFDVGKLLPQNNKNVGKLN